MESLQGKPALVFYNFQHDKERILKAVEKSSLRIRELRTYRDEDDWNCSSTNQMVDNYPFILPLPVKSLICLSVKLIIPRQPEPYHDDGHRVHEVHGCKIEAFLELVESLQGKPPGFAL